MLFQISAHWIILAEERWCIQKFEEAYREYMKEGLINYSEFYNQYGEIGFKRIYDEINLWVTDPKLFIRDYTIEYIDMILKGENIN